MIRTTVPDASIATYLWREGFQMRIQMRLAGQLSALAIAALMAGSAGAVPISVNETAFSGTATVIDFTGLSSGTSITSQYSSEGATFSGGLYAFPIGKASNFDISLTEPGTSITIDFVTKMLRAGFDVSTQSTQDLRVGVSAFSGDLLVSTGSLDFITTGTTTRFVGIEDLDMGIDRLVLTAFPVNASSSGRFIIDDVTFEAAAVVPEPSAALLFPIGMLFASYGIRRRRQPA
jgi:hypothetical protein